MVWTCDQGENVKPSEYNDGKDLTFSYVLQKNLSEVRNYSLKHYWYPFTGSELGSLDKLVQNPGW